MRNSKRFYEILRDFDKPKISLVKIFWSSTIIEDARTPLFFSTKNLQSKKLQIQLLEDLGKRV